MTSPLAARLSRFLVGCHPRRWRQRYAADLLEVLDQHRPTARTVLNLWASAVSAHLDRAWRAGRHPRIRPRPGRRRGQEPAHRPPPGPPRRQSRVRPAAEGPGPYPRRVAGGTVCITSLDDKVYALDAATGNLRWAAFCSGGSRTTAGATDAPAVEERLGDMRSGGGALTDGSAAEVRVLEGRGQVGGLVGRADVGAGRDDLVDPVEDLVGERDVDAGEQVIELLHRARPDEGAGHAGMGDRERHREVRHRQARLLRDRDELLDGVEPALVTEARPCLPQSSGIDLMPR